MTDRWKTQDEFPGSISLPFGVKTSHTWHEVGQILRIINDLDISTFIELGTHVGGLSSMLTCISRYKPFSYYGYDIKTDWADQSIFGYLRLRDVMSDETVSEISTLVTGRTMIYCDGGNKISEMELYKTILNPNDVIACHDYYGGQAVFGLKDFGISKECGCVPEVSPFDLHFDGWTKLPYYLLEGTRLMGFIK
jgi:hypothetical protein